jgi:hypothetical protein
MPTIQGEQIKGLVELFKSRKVKLYHACQLVDFKTYLELGGIPSRNLMELSDSSHTAFDTDETDKKNEVWDKVFLNLEDFGYGFAQGKRNVTTAPVPNPYGPILLVFKPEILVEATDISVCLRSAGATDFNRDAESLVSIEEINRIFVHELNTAPYDLAKTYVKFKNALQKEFPDRQAMSPEINCMTADEVLSFTHLDAIIVDAYFINEKPLTDEVEWLKTENNLSCPVWKRFYNNDRPKIKQELANLLLEEIKNLR